MADIPTVAEITSGLVAAQHERLDAQDALQAACVRAAEAKDAYRRRKSEVRLRLRAEHAESGERVTVDDLSAMVDAACGAERFEAYVAEALEYAAKRAVEQAADNVSSWQTLANLARDEARGVFTGPDVGVQS